MPGAALFPFFFAGRSDPRKMVIFVHDIRRARLGLPPPETPADMTRTELIRRYAVFIAGLFILALGIALGVHADLGIAPISCPPYVLSLGIATLTLGEFTILLHLLLIVLQIALLRRNFQKIQLLQVVMAFLFGYFCDFGLWLTQPFVPHTYAGQFALMLLSCGVQAVGISLEISAGVLVLAGEGAQLAIARVTGIEFSRVKIAFDSAMVLLGVGLSLWLFGGRIEGIREGTLVSALLIGFIIRYIRPAVERFTRRITAPHRD